MYASLPQVLEEGELAPSLSRADLLRHFADWHPDLRRLIAEADDAVRPWPIYMLPPEHRWVHRPTVTLIGDAAHLMPPAGEGANLALRDAADLADALCSHDWHAAVRAHEQTMMTRAAVAAASAQRLLTANSPAYLLEALGGDADAGGAVHSAQPR